MISRLYNFWQILKGNLWFIPALFCLVFLGFISALYYLETQYLYVYDFPDYVFQGSTDDAKSVTTTLLSAMITMATLAISITIVVLSLAASQLGPRLIKSFMADRKTKDFIGLFFGTVMACFVLTIILHSRISEAVTPQITISVVFMMCLINLFVLLGFVHHVAQSCIADNVILKVSDDLKNALRRLTKDSIPRNRDRKPDVSNWPKDFEDRNRHIYFKTSGYVQHINYESLMALSEKHSLRIKINFKSGHFLVRGEDGVRVYAKTKTPEDLDDQIIDCFIIGRARTPTQDIEYSIRHLVEIAIRALSPGINDSFTAINVLDHLSAALATLLEKETPSEHFYDEEGIKRIEARQSSEEDIIFSALDQIRYNGATMPSIMRHILEKISILAELSNDQAEKKALLDQVKAIAHDLDNITRAVPDREVMKGKIKLLTKRLR